MVINRTMESDLVFDGELPSVPCPIALPIHRDTYGYYGYDEYAYLSSISYFPTKISRDLYVMYLSVSVQVRNEEVCKIHI